MSVTDKYSIRLPSLGDDERTSGQIISFLEPGTKVSSGQIFMEIETDKVVIEVPAEIDGVIAEYSVAIGDTVSGGDIVGAITGLADGSASMTRIESTAESEEKEVIDNGGSEETLKNTVLKNYSIRLPSLGDDERTRGQIISLLDVGTEVCSGQIFMEVETDKVVIEVPAEVDGVIAGYSVAVGDTVCGGDVVGTITGGVEDAAPTHTSAEVDNAALSGVVAVELSRDKIDELSSPEQRSVPDPTAKLSETIAAGPAARQLARTLGVNLTDVSGTGPRGRITKDDIKKHVREALKAPSQTASQPATLKVPDISIYGEVERQSLSGIAKATSRNMQQSWSEIPHAWVQEEIDITELESLRKLVKQRAKGDVPLTVTAILCKVVALALQKFPVFNSIYDRSAEEIVVRRYINIGVAVDTPRGLVVPGIRDVGAKSGLEIAEELKTISQRAIAAKLSTADFQGNGFTISNLGGIGVSGLLPVVNWPEVAILGVSSSRNQCRLTGEKVENRLIMPVTLGFDHRVINGADAARFLSYIKEILEEPGMLLIG